MTIYVLSPSSVRDNRVYHVLGASWTESVRGGSVSIETRRGVIVRQLWMRYFLQCCSVCPAVFAWSRMKLFLNKAAETYFVRPE
jgi:hypothetical protein